MTLSTTTKFLPSTKEIEAAAERIKNDSLMLEKYVDNKRSEATKPEITRGAAAAIDNDATKSFVAPIVLGSLFGMCVVVGLGYTMTNKRS